MKSTIASGLLIAAIPALAGTTPQPSFEQPLVTYPEAAGDWSVRFVVYGWLQSLDGEVAVRGNSADLDLKFTDLVKDLDMAFMGATEITYGRWGLLVDLNYADIGAKIPTPFGRLAPFIDFSQEQWMVNTLITYQVLDTPSTGLDVYAGARMNDIEVNLGINNRTFSGQQTWIDPVIGLRFQQALSPSFFFRAAGDIGGFGVSSDFTWQALAGFGWRFNECGSAFIGYRAVDTDYTQGGFKWDVNTHGPTLGLEFVF